MANAVIMPKAGITVESCIIGNWEKKVGDAVKVGDILFTYETDKASFECESTEEGTLLEIFFNDGDEVPCLVNVCAIGNPGDDCSALRPEGSAEAAPEAAAAPVEAAPVAAAPVAVESTAVAGEKSAVSPRAKKLAERSGVDASLATPTGPNGRVIERDVRELIDNPVAAAAPVVTAPAAVAASETEYEDVKFSGIRRAISKSMMTSLSTIAQLTHNTSFDASAILAYRKQLKASEGDCAGITLGDIVLMQFQEHLRTIPTSTLICLTILQSVTLSTLTSVLQLIQREDLWFPQSSTLMRRASLKYPKRLRSLPHSAARVISAPISSAEHPSPFPISVTSALSPLPLLSILPRPEYLAYAELLTA